MQTVKKHIIGGLTGGIGAELARQLLDAGHEVGGFARSAEAVQAWSSENGGPTRSCDATDPQALTEAIQSLHEEMGAIDSYTHAIGSILLKPAHLTSDQEWAHTLRCNLDSAFYALRVVAKLMSKQGHGSCLFFSTAAAQTGIANHEAIAAAKGGIEAMVRSAAASYAGHGLRINAVAPSLTETPLSQAIVGNPQALAISQRMHPLGRIGQPADIASLAAWLHSEHAQFVTGQTFVADGGISTIVPKPKV